MQEEDVSQIAELVTEYAGPLGKFIVVKEFQKAMKMVSELSSQEIKEIISNIVVKSVYNPQTQGEVRNLLLKRYAYPSNI